MLVAVVCLLVAVVVHHRLPARAQTAWLLFLSYAFYAWWAWRFLPALVLLTLASYAIATRIGPRPASRNAGSQRRRIWLWAGVVVNVTALALLRYGYRSAPFEAPFAVLGVSFYSLQAVAYVVDTYSGALRTPPRLAAFATYLAYFPKIVAGPIERPQAFLRQLAQSPTVDDTRLARATTLILVGLTRKLVLADPLAALLPLPAFSEPGGRDALILTTLLVGYAFVLYNDFAGYTSIARGISCLFGIELSPNFAQPFAAHSFTNLWNRWHITFSHWLRDYIYLPLSRELLRRDLRRTNVANLLLPPIATMLACGLWHGASVHMLLWGGLHGVYLVLERVANLRWPAAPAAVRPAWRYAAGAVLVFAVSCWTLVALRLPIAQALRFWQQLLIAPIGALPDGRVLLFMLPSIWLDWMQSRHGEDVVFMPWPRLARAAMLAVAVLLCLAAAGVSAPAPFVYQGF
jgi:D-alanyl-lipoteichoic acid acyltransferase DltB (MBOAT superfamily)